MSQSVLSLPLRRAKTTDRRDAAGASVWQKGLMEAEASGTIEVIGEVWF